MYFHLKLNKRSLSLSLCKVHHPCSVSLSLRYIIPGLFSDVATSVRVVAHNAAGSTSAVYEINALPSMNYPVQDDWDPARGMGYMSTHVSLINFFPSSYQINSSPSSYQINSFPFKYQIKNSQSSYQINLFQFKYQIHSFQLINSV